eukprot:tig00000981_g5860.t1
MGPHAPAAVGAPIAWENADNRKRIAIIGSGASGVAAAWSLARFPEKFEVHVFEKAACAGGVATSVDIGGGRYVNDGVQGGSVAYRNTALLLAEHGFKTNPVHMKVSFGKGPTHWNNSGRATPVQERFRDEIRRFGSILKFVSALEALFISVPISKLLGLFGFSEDFGNLMVYPLTALFFGTGNQTPSVSAAIIARVFLDPDLRLFDYDPALLLSQSPEMFAFPSLAEIYERVSSKSAARFHFGRPATRVVRRDDGRVSVWYPLDARPAPPPSQPGPSYTPPAEPSGPGTAEAVFDAVVFACDAETVLKVLESPGRLERWTLGNVRYYNDVTVTHEDGGYMERNYDADAERGDQYFVRLDPADPARIDMSFHLSNYQPQLRGSGRTVYQTIFLDDERREKWSMGEIDPSKILLVKWWRQFAHTWRHFVSVVPFVRTIQDSGGVYYAGAWTLFNTHEVAIISGLAAAHRLGAPYPFASDPLARKQFEMYLSLIHGASLPKDFGRSPGFDAGARS